MPTGVLWRNHAWPYRKNRFIHKPAIAAIRKGAQWDAPIRRFGLVGSRPGADRMQHGLLSFAGAPGRRISRRRDQTIG
jgi:hypothetical protein